MSNLTKASRARIRGKGTATYAIKNGVTLFIGAYVDIEDATGRIESHADSSGNKPLGRVVEFESPLQDGGSAVGNSAGTVKATVDIEGGILEKADVVGVTAEANVGEAVYLTSDNLETDLTLTPTTNVPAVGELVRRNGSNDDCDVLLYSAETMRGL